MKTNKMNDMIFQFIKKIVFLLTFTFTLSGCLIENNVDEIEEPINGNEVTITVNIPAQQLPSTRSIADGGGEAKVETIDIFVFKPDGAGETLTQHAVGKELSQSTDGNQKYEVQFKASLASNVDASTVVILANVPESVVSSALAVGDSKQAILNVLIYSNAEKWKANAGDYTPIPMYGEWALSDKGITSSMKISGIPLTRMLARIDMVNNAPGFTLKEVYLVNRNDRGYIAPAWKTGGVLETALPANPMIPASANQMAGEANALAYAYSGSGLVGEIYTFEALKTTGIEGNTTHTNAICLIIKGRRSSDAQDSYYRIDFTQSKDEAGKAPEEAGFNPTKVSYMPVYRNHRYLFSIDAVNSAGYAQFNDALKSLGIMNNLKTRLLVVDESGIKNVAFNGQHYLGIGDDVTLGYEMNSVASPKCETNYAYGWQLDTSKGTNGIEYSSGGSGWLSVVKSGDNINLKTLSDNLTGQNRIAYVHVKAGLLANKLKVTQEFGIIPPDPGPDPRGESNCYIIKNGDLTPLIIPVSQVQYAMNGSTGNGSGFLGTGWITNYNNLKVQVLWSDINKFGTDDAVVKSVTYNNPATNYATLANATISVTPGKGKGNAGIILYEDNNGNGSYNSGDAIRWSWHIWNSDYYPYNEDGTPNGKKTGNQSLTNEDWMDRNIGATTNTPGDVNTRGFMYQWGRKDPYPHTSGTLYYAPGSGVSFSQTSNSASNNLSNSVLNPLTRYYYGSITPDWFTTSTSTAYENGDLWGGRNGFAFLHPAVNGVRKSVYDPCPDGFRLPRINEWGTSSWGSFANYGRINNNYGGFYPAVGKRNGSDGGSQIVNENGNYWAATPNYTNGNRGSFLTFNDLANASTGGYEYRAVGHSVRCRRQ